MVKIITDFSKISGLKANMDKTMVCPLGENFSIEEEDQFCPELKLVRVISFRLLGLVFDSRLKNMKKITKPNS